MNHAILLLWLPVSIHGSSVPLSCECARMRVAAAAASRPMLYPLLAGVSPQNACQRQLHAFMQQIVLWKDWVALNKPYAALRQHWAVLTAAHRPS
jgi:hypothetical protein